jgi:hypothetical protein
MRILTHNHLICVVKTCTRNYPLRIDATKIEQGESDFNADFIAHILSSIDYAVLSEVAKQLSVTIPVLAEGLSQNEEFLRILHTILLDVCIPSSLFPMIDRCI